MSLTREEAPVYTQDQACQYLKNRRISPGELLMYFLQDKDGGDLYILQQDM